MVHVTLYKNEKSEYVGFTAIGHAGYADPGQDIVCAAASVLMINTVNALERFTDIKSTLVSNDEEGLIDYRLDEKPDMASELLLKTMVLGLKDLENDEDYRQYIEIQVEEV